MKQSAFHTTLDSGYLLEWMCEMGEKVNVVDVTPRDGLQNEKEIVSTREKLLLIEKLTLAGIKEIQATSFVHPRWVPQMADAEAVAEPALKVFWSAIFRAGAES